MESQVLSGAATISAIRKPSTRLTSSHFSTLTPIRVPLTNRQTLRPTRRHLFVDASSDRTTVLATPSPALSVTPPHTLTASAEERREYCILIEILRFKTEFFFSEESAVSGSLGDNCLQACPASSELCLKSQKPKLEIPMT